MKARKIPLYILAVPIFIMGCILLFFIVSPNYKVFIRPNFEQGKFKYCPKKFLNEICWANSLQKLEQIKKNKKITHAKAVIGNVPTGSHMWIFYIKDKKEYCYDPMINKTWSVKYGNGGYIVGDSIIDMETE